MKKIIAICLLIYAALVCGHMAFAEEDDLEMYSFLYGISETNTDQLKILETMRDQNISGAGDFYAKALHRLVNGYSNIVGATQLDAADKQAVILSIFVGNEKNGASAQDLWQVVIRFKDPIARAEALAALGKVHARIYLPHIVRILTDLNNLTAQDMLYSERIAYGAITALKNYAEPECYLPVYFASIGWYPDWVRNLAAESLPAITNDPSPFMSEIINSPGYEFKVKYAALQNTEASGMDNEKKAVLAFDALREAWLAYTYDLRQNVTMGELRKLALKMIGKYGAPDTSVYPLMERSCVEGLGITEKEDAINALKRLANDDAAKVLSKLLMKMNIKLKSDLLTHEDHHLVRLIIPALGSIKSQVAIASLNATISSDWPSFVKFLAQNALRQIRG